MKIIINAALLTAISPLTFAQNSPVSAPDNPMLVVPPPTPGKAYLTTLPPAGAPKAQTPQFNGTKPNSSTPAIQKKTSESK